MVGQPLILQMVLIILSLVLLVPYLVLVLYYRKSWLDIRVWPRQAASPPEPPVMISVVIAARNEEKTIGRCLQSLLNQEYPANQFEILVVDDHSTDATASIADEVGKGRVRVLSLKDYTGGRPENSYKKRAIEAGIAQATGSLIVTTDADCTAGPHWLESITSFFRQTGSVFIAAPVVLRAPQRRRGFFSTLLEIFQSLDFVGLQEITGASVFKRFHYMCNGANLTYEKRYFMRWGGLKGLMNSPAGMTCFCSIKSNSDILSE